MPLQFGVFDHIEPIPGQDLGQIYEDRLTQVERFDACGFYAYHLAEHHTPAVHSLAPSQNVFLAAAARSTSRIKLNPCIYVLPLHHPLRLIEEICMLDHLSAGRLEVGVGRGGVLEAYFWGSDWDVERNYQKYVETLDIVRQGLSHESLTYQGHFYQFDDLPMRLQPRQRPYPPMWYMRNVEIAAREGMHSIIVGNLASFAPNVVRYKHLWEQCQGVGARTLQGDEPKIGLVTHMVIAPTEAEAVEAARPAWNEYVWNLTTPRRLEAERRGLSQFLGRELNPRPVGLPEREAGAEYRARVADTPEHSPHRAEPGQVTEAAQSAGFRVVAGTPATIRAYLDEYLTTGANYFVCAFHFGNMPEMIAQRSIDLFIDEVMPAYTG
ncbi:MAG: LLM class flavin-dependent oxidoreductase [Candidatus Tectomicrobia bacterium]|uniref:LLM class flavin-dependent oxidoreductase n=1 Tax=Tectimicrobiota bacterium TaxID=2528274 RepID=A0A938B253_UNCTE|nr:LLM class flavin-dependent oxidoreductase [Candidatus Tectomicrobia bacterium]